MRRTLPSHRKKPILEVQGEAGLQVGQRARGRTQREVRGREHGLRAGAGDVRHRGRHVWKWKH